jgi:putative endonuclease
MERLEAHNAGKVTSTRKFRPWRVVFQEGVEEYNDARKRELYYKTGAGRRKIKSIFDELGIN